ncbi:hypothetical protein [Salipaludibacillus daqingensis]|uniref:hypothetical protein n=1 Tax=Salipaludibacillus daqingensis TaxID=3041001 RepID=UPI0024772090|nr:hypothetical protein [Salipaludibacillus daqingensis]
MDDRTIYFKDNFFSNGVTPIFNGEKVQIGQLDLKSAFSSSVDVQNADGKVVVKGAFPFMSRKWGVVGEGAREMGSLKQKIAFFAKKFEYTTDNRGTISIHSGAFSNEYTMMNEKEEVIAEFKRISGFFEAPVFQLINDSQSVDNEEMIAVVMGVNMINKRNRRNRSHS